MPVKLSESQIDQIFELWQDRLNPQQIAIRMRLPYTQVYYQLKKRCLVD